MAIIEAQAVVLFVKVSSAWWAVDYYCDKMWIYILQLVSKKRVRTLFLFQPFRGNPGYDEVTDLPFSTSCLSNLTSNDSEINIKSITKCRMETMYNSTCINERYR